MAYDGDGNGRPNLEQIVWQMREQVRFLNSQMAALNTTVHNARVENQNSLSELKEEMKEAIKPLVSRQEFSPVKTIVYGATGIILAAVFSTMVYLVLRSQ